MCTITFELHTCAGPKKIVNVHASCLNAGSETSLQSSLDVYMLDHEFHLLRKPCSLNVVYRLEVWTAHNMEKFLSSAGHQRTRLRYLPSQMVEKWFLIVAKYDLEGLGAFVNLLIRIEESNIYIQSSIRY